jgi:FHA domain-containing protein
LAPASSIGQAMGPGALDSLDDLFGLGAPSSGADPLGATPQQALLMQPNMAAHADPLQSLGRPASAAQASQSDHVSELNTPMSLPRAPASVAAAVTPPAGLPSGAIFSWDDPPRDGRVVTLPGRPRGDAGVGTGLPAAVAAAVPAFSPQAAPLPASTLASPATAIPTPSTTPPPRAAAGDAALIAALLQGLGAPGVRIEALTPELMLLIGQLLRESTRGAVELLLARTALKREMRAQVTMIVARENNPLKFSPSVEMALQHLLSPTTPGFMPAANAVRDAFDDLRAHQLGVMAGMKAALDGVLQRFDPQQLEAQLSSRSTLANLIPSSRKAKLWELFQQLFGQLSTEAQDDFDELFGKAFLRAYEAQLDRLHAEPGRE